MVAVAPAIHAGLVTVAEPSHGTVTRELLPLAVTLNVACPAVSLPIWQFRVIFTPPELAAAAAGEGLIASAPAITAITPSFCTPIAPFVPGRRLFSTHIVIGLVLRTLRNPVWADVLAAALAASTASSIQMFE
jgi:hypothetical protein